MKIFGQDREIGHFDKSVCTDIMTIVERQRRRILGKGRKIELSENRMKNIVDALI